MGRRKSKSPGSTLLSARWDCARARFTAVKVLPSAGEGLVTTMVCSGCSDCRLLSRVGSVRNSSAGVSCELLRSSRCDSGAGEKGTTRTSLSMPGWMLSRSGPTEDCRLGNLRCSPWKTGPIWSTPIPRPSGPTWVARRRCTLVGQAPSPRGTPSPAWIFPQLSRRSRRSRLVLQQIVALALLQDLHHIAHLLGAVAVGDQQRVGSIDHDQVRNAHQRHHLPTRVHVIAAAGLADGVLQEHIAVSVMRQQLIDGVPASHIVPAELGTGDTRHATRLLHHAVIDGNVPAKRECLAQFGWETGVVEGR